MDKVFNEETATFRRRRQQNTCITSWRFAAGADPTQSLPPQNFTTVFGPAYQQDVT